ncbi:MAG: response regulator transcription factor [Clostridia bacterium]|nr:response regulator transcription factor [Clostridia bacterium]
MENIRILIGDDDAGMRLVMKKLVEKAEAYELVGEAKDGCELIELFDRERPDVVLMDVEMPGMNGIDCGKAIQDRAPKTIIIFATAHEEYMRSAFELYAFDYLVKPFSVERALNTLRLARERLGERRVTVSASAPKSDALRRLMIRHKDGVRLVNPEDILMVQREDRSTAILLRDGEKLLTGDPLGEVEERLPPELFFRSHRSYIINLEQIDSIAPYGRWTHIVRLRGTREDALITHEKFEELEKLFQ